MHVRRHIAEADVPHAVEFADLLDPIRTTPFAAPLIAASTVAGHAVDADMAFADMLVSDMLVSDLLEADVLEADLLEADTVEADQPGSTSEIVDEVVAPDPVVVSRFADAGVDDDRLPLHAATKRFRLR